MGQSPLEFAILVQGDLRLGRVLIAALVVLWLVGHGFFGVGSGKAGVGGVYGR